MQISLVVVYGVRVPVVASYRTKSPTFNLGTTALTEDEYRELGARGEASDTEWHNGRLQLRVGVDSVRRLFDCEYGELFGVPVAREELTDSTLLTLPTYLTAEAAAEFGVVAEKYGVSGDPDLHLWFDFT